MTWFAAAAPSAISSSEQIISQVMNNVFQQDVNQAQRAFNKDMAEWAYSKDVEMWEKTNQYNSPAEQKQRLIEAGLNPRLMIDKMMPGQAASSMPKMNVPEGQFGGYQPFKPLDIIGAYQDYRLREAEIDKVKAQVDLINKQAFNTNWIGLASETNYKNLDKKWLDYFEQSGLKTEWQKIQNDMGRSKLIGYDLQNMWIREKMPYDLQGLKLRNDLYQQEWINKGQQYWNMVNQNRMTLQDLKMAELKYNLADKYGINFDKDDLVTRMVSQVFGQKVLDSLDQNRWLPPAEDYKAAARGISNFVNKLTLPSWEGVKNWFK